MLVAIDTSVLVAWVVEKHVFHTRAEPWFAAMEDGKLDAVVCAHAPAELYSVLTKLPEGLSPVAAQLAVRNIANRARVVPLTSGMYDEAIDHCAKRGLKSGSVFDSLHVVAAERRGARLLLTFNPADFTRLVAGGEPRIVVPPEPPSVDPALSEL